MGNTTSRGRNHRLVEGSARENDDQSTTLAPSVISTTSHPVGCETLFEGKTPLVADLVFVHGLCGHRRDTWTKDGVCWPEELLPNDEAFSHVRILTFGYDANVVGPMGRASLNSLFDHSINLLTGLSRERRQNARDRPIIFVAHCLGGLLVKDALNQSADVKETKPHLAQVVSATRGVIFLGTPHRGSTLTSLANLVASVAQMALQGSNRDLVWDLERNSQVLDRIRDSFGRLLDRRTFTVWSFIEEMPMAGGEKVVHGESAIIGDAHENRETIHADHVSMTKFVTKDDAEYKKITYAIEVVLEEFLKQRDHAGSPLSHPIPSPSTLFTGRRKYLEKLRHHFFPHKDKLQQRKQFVLYGMGGVGKTQICLKFAEESANQFRYIFWIDAANSEAAELSFKFIADYPEVRAAGVENSMQSVLQWISWITDPWLLVIDNADNDSEIVAKCMPHGTYGNVLITSRNPDMRRHSPEAHAEVEEIEEEDAISLLLKAAFLPADSEDLRCTSRAIVKELYCLPLAVDQAGALIARGFCNIENYLQMYANHHCKLLDHPTFKGASNYGKAVYGTWDLSFEALLARASLESSKKDSNGARNAIILLQIFSFLHHDGIREEIFRQAATSLDYKHNAIASSWSADVLDELLQVENGGEWNPLFFKAGIENLLSFSLLRRGTYADVYSMHPLVHQWSRDRVTLSEQQSQYECARGLLCCSIIWTFAGADYAFRQSLIPHIKANSQHGSKAGIPIRYNRDEYRKFALAFNENGHWKEAEKLEIKVMESDLKIFGTEHLDTLAIMGDLALTYWNQGRWKEAEELQIKVMETRKKILEAEHPDILTAMGNLASTYWIQGRWKEAEKLQVKVMETSLGVLGAEHPSTLTIIGNLASTYRNQGRWKEAENLQIKVMETSLKILGAEHPSTLTTMDSLASTYRNQGRWKEAEELQVKVVEIRKTVLGTEHPSTLTTMGNLALTYRNQGRWTEAEKLKIKVMETRKRVLGAKHPDTLTTMSDLALTYRNQGRWKEAEELQVKVMETRKRVLEAEHPDTLTTMSNLASTYRHQGRWEEAVELQINVMETRKRVLGAEHPDTLTTMGNLASTYRDQGEWKGAEELEVKVMEARKRVLGTEHPHALITMGNLALTYWNQGRVKEAEELQVRVMETRKRVLGAEHPDTLTAMSNLASTYRHQGRWKEAEELQIVMETRKRVLGVEHPDTLKTMGNLALNYRNQEGEEG